MGRTIFALFDDFPTAQRVAGALEFEGYDREGISVLAPDPRSEHLTAAREVDTNGARITSLPFAPLTIPGVGPAAATGPLAKILAEANGASGGLVSSLTRLGFDDPDARHFYECMRRGESIVAVEAPDNRVRQTEEAMRRLGARAVDVTPSIASASIERRPAAAMPPREGPRDRVTMPVVEEQLEVGKRQVNRGGVRIHTQVVEEPVQEDVLLREERVSVERRPVSRDATEADLAEFKEGSIEIHETSEEVVISKRRRVVEEIVIGRETRERTETITDTVRKTQVHVEELAADDGGAGESDLRALHEGTSRRGERFERYEPAYRYGSALGADERYRQAEWTDVEPQARRAWEERNAGTWEEFKDAVRHAWEKVTGR